MSLERTDLNNTKRESINPELAGLLSNPIPHNSVKFLVFVKKMRELVKAQKTNTAENMAILERIKSPADNEWLETEAIYQIIFFGYMILNASDREHHEKIHDNFLKKLLDDFNNDCVSRFFGKEHCQKIISIMEKMGDLELWKGKKLDFLFTPEALKCMQQSFKKLEEEQKLSTTHIMATFKTPNTVEIKTTKQTITQAKTPEVERIKETESATSNVSIYEESTIKFKAR